MYEVHQPSILIINQSSPISMWPLLAHIQLEPVMLHLRASGRLGDVTSTLGYPTEVGVFKIVYVYTTKKYQKDTKHQSYMHLNPTGFAGALQWSFL